MPTPFGPLLGFALGIAFAWVARGELAKDDRPLVMSPALRVVCGFAALIYLPILAYFCAFHGDWAYLYWLGSQRVPSAVDLALVLLSGASIPGAFVLAAPAAAAGRTARLAVLAGVPLGIALTTAMLFHRRLGVSGSYAQVHGGFGTEPIGSSTLGRGVLLAGVVLALALLWTRQNLRQNPRRGRGSAGT